MPKFYYDMPPAAPRLGSIYRDIGSLGLQAPLNMRDRLDIPPELSNRSGMSGFGATRDSGLGGSVGVAAEVPGLVSGDLVYTFAKTGNVSYSCTLLETDEFIPTAEYIEASIKASETTSNYLEGAMFGRRRVFMITGLKIATEFSIETSSQAKHGPRLKIVAATPATGPVAIGPVLDAEGSRGSTMKGKTLNKIIFAYRAIKIRMKGDGEAKWKHLRSGKYGLGDDDDDDDDDDDTDDGDDENGGANKKAGARQAPAWVVEDLDDDARLKDFPESSLVEIVACSD
ncbi:hypothetical protein MAPG_04514 [Magnaporthiopsis poae ATCC 64411]|uniref:Uncharacterized protein n=1 Tax=Magnaporthiopsis poae (strain ATCC 64411 / 73-15) TaxID=644358 RepID=A0A0C4DWY0_MAGP6|nr:hypothetical protein MAPG_04514 [Magnaporthiopsis poae ATCC 64411]